MTANSAASFASLEAGINDIDNLNGGDDDFGDFVFSSPSFSSQLIPYRTPTVTSFSAAANDEDWGDFVASPLDSHPVQVHSSSPFSPHLDPLRLSCNAWVKPMGAIPLSIFGEEEAEEVDPERIDCSGISENGFGSYSTFSSQRTTTPEKLNDLIERLYGLAGSVGKKADENSDAESWEFKDALAADTRTEAAVDRSENGWKVMEQFSMNFQERERVDIFAEHEGLTNSSIDYNHYEKHEELTNSSIDYNHSETAKDLHMLPNFGKQTLSSNTNGFKMEFLKNALSKGTTEKIQHDQAEVLHPPQEQEDIKEVEWNLLIIDDLSISAFASNKKNSHGYSEDQIETCTEAGKMDYSSITLTGIIHNLYEKTDKLQDTLSSQISATNGVEIKHHLKTSAYVNGDTDFDELDWEFQNAVMTGDAEKVAVCGSSQSLSNELISYTLADLYYRLKEVSLSLIVDHLIVLKVSSLPVETSEVQTINEAIKETYGSLLERIASEDASFEKQVSGHFNQVLNVTRTSNFKSLEQEYELSKRLLAAEKDLNAAADLFKHSSTVLQILRSESDEHQLFYINAWFKLASACAVDLQLGAKIWTESLDTSISQQILFKGSKYFIALGEVYRVSKLLKATARFYKPWLLSNPKDSAEMVTCLDKGIEVWKNSGLDEALGCISSSTDIDDEGLANSLLESIVLIDAVIESTVQDSAFSPNDSGFCKLTLLPFDMLPGLGRVFWKGEWFITKVANFWANRVSAVPPELPPIHNAELDVSAA